MDERFPVTPCRPEDLPALKALWAEAFGDGEDYIDSFHRNLLASGGCVTARAGGEVVSAMYVIGGVRLYPFRREVIPCGYTYALATRPDYRGRGIGTAVYNAAAALAMREADAACVIPQGPDLFPFYEKTGARRLGGVREATLSPAALACPEPLRAVRVPGWQYAGMREWFLSELPHASFPEALYDHLEETGAEFFLMEHGCAAVETEGNRCRILELLSPGRPWQAAAAGVARWCRAEEYLLRTPLFFDGPGETAPQALLTFRRMPSYPLPDDFWWGLAMD